MLDRNLMKRTDDRSLQETPDVLYGVGIDGATGVLANRVVDSLMAGIFVADARVRLPVVCVDGLSSSVSPMKNSSPESSFLNLSIPLTPVRPLAR